jgi:hypothetical protein
MYLNVLIICFNAFIVCFNVFQCVWMYFNVFECIYWHCNWISPSLSQCSVFAVHIHLHIFFHSIQWLPSQHAILLCFFFFHSCWSIPTFIQSILTFHVYKSSHIPHSMSSLVARSVAEPKWIFHLEVVLISYKFLKFAIQMWSMWLISKTWKLVTFVAFGLQTSKICNLLPT